MFEPIPESIMTALEVAEPLQIPAIVYTERYEVLAPANTITGVGSIKPIVSAI